MSSIPKSPIRIGTSGYTYSWNKRRPSAFAWYVKQGFNSVEINASYYRFPLDSWIKTWRASVPQDFSFSIKVNRSITDYLRLKGDRAVDLWNRFSKTLEGIYDKIDFWLFKMPKTFRYTEQNLETVRVFFEKSALTKDSKTSAVIEFRDPSWWEAIDRIEDSGAVFCSVDAPRSSSHCTRNKQINLPSDTRIQGMVSLYIPRVRARRDIKFSYEIESREEGNILK